MSVNSSRGVRGGVEDGVEWKLLLSPLGNCVNGYVRLPAGHPWAEIGDYDRIPAAVHGGLTYGPQPARDLRPYLPIVSPAHATAWIGFDTGHFNDRWNEADLAAAGGRYRPEWSGGDHEWTLAAVEHETRALARQVAAAARSTTEQQEVTP